MALVTNRRNAASYARGTIVGDAQAWDVVRTSSLVNIYADESLSIDNKSGIPKGYNTGAILLPMKAGGMSSFNPQALVITANSALARMGRNLAGSATLTLTVTNAQADQIVSLVGSATCSIVVTNAALTAGVQAAASSTMTIIANASLGGIIPITASTTGTLTPSVTMTALAFIIAEAGGPTPLSPEGLADAVWAAPAVDNNAPGTMGEKLNDAGGAGNPWSAELASNNTDGTFGAFVQKLLTVAKFLGLK